MTRIIKIRSLLITILHILMIICCFTITLYGDDPSGDKNKQNPSRVTTNDVDQSFTINNLFNYYSNNGDGSYNNFKGMSGLEFPKGNNTTVVFEDGLLIGGKTRTSSADATVIVKVGGSAYRHGWQAGRIITPGTSNTTAVADNPELPANRIYRVRPDVNPSKTFAMVQSLLESEELLLIVRSETDVTAQKIYDQYIADWNEWPASQGAPYTDVNGNGTYDPAFDIPGVTGADQTLWHVSNDLDEYKTQFLYGSKPIGIELQRTVWGYKRSGALGNTIFTKYIIINKSGAKIDSTYVAQWSDPDIGGVGDDFTGCDTLLSLGFAYNGKANDEQYGFIPPAMGYDFFQGALVNGLPTDSGKANGKYVYGKKNLPMTAFTLFLNGNATYNDPPQGVSIGTTQWYNLMQGLVGNIGAPIHAFLDPSKPITTFVNSGDPVAGTGWLDGVIAPPGDRRLAMSSGPFTMTNGDTQEIVIATIVGRGGDRISSVSVLKYYDKIAQYAYDVNFNLVPPPAAPVVTVAAIDNQVVLDWGNEATSKITESANANGFKFQGYNIFQSTTAAYSPENSKRIATFDIVDGIGTIKDEVFDLSLGTTVVKPVQFGNDYGIQRVYTITEDIFTHQTLVNGNSYYFFVTAYSYNPDHIAMPNTLESEPVIFHCVPQTGNPNEHYGKKSGDTLNVTHTLGISDGIILAIVTDPLKLTGHDYKITFDTANSNGAQYWKLTDVTIGKVLLDKQFNQTGSNDFYTVDGMLIKIIDSPSKGMKPGVQGSAISSSPDIGFEIVTGIRAFTWAGGGSPFGVNGMEGFGGGMGGGFQFNRLLLGPLSTIAETDLSDLLIELAGTDAKGNIINPASDTVSLAYRYVRNGQLPPTDSSFIPFLPPNTPAAVDGSYGYVDRRPCPIRIYEWNAVTQTIGQRLNFGFLENNIAKSGSFSGGKVDGLYWPPTNSEVTSYVAATDPREWLFIFRSTYSATTPDPKLTVNLLFTPTPMLYWWTVARRSGVLWAGNSYKIISYKPNTIKDVFTFTSYAPTSVEAKEELPTTYSVSQNYPNPFNPTTRIDYQLPQKEIVSLKIYDMLGREIALLVHEEKNAGRYSVQWNATQFSSGVYFATMRAGNFSITKKLLLMK